MGKTTKFNVAVASIIIGGLLSSAGCATGMSARNLPESATVRYGENGVPTYVKGDNLSAHLDEDPGFLKLREQRRYAEMAYEFLLSRKGLFKINDPRREFAELETKTDGLGYKHVKFQQTAKGTPVWGRQLSVHFGKDDGIYLVQGRYEPSQKFTDEDTSPALSSKEAARQAVEAAPRDGGPWRAGNIEKYIYITERGLPRLAYRVTLHGPSERRFYFIDAQTGGVLHTISGTYESGG